MERTKRRAITQAAMDTYLREALGSKKVVRNGRAVWIRDKSIKESKLQFGAGMPITR
jgi:hypothetical protein